MATIQGAQLRDNMLGKCVIAKLIRMAVQLFEEHSLFVRLGHNVQRCLDDIVGVCVAHH